MSDPTLTDKTLALAGMYQAAALVSAVGHRGYAEEAPCQASLNSLFIKDPGSSEEVYGGVDNLQLGLQTLVQQFRSSDKRDFDVTRYVLALLQLERKLTRKPEMLTLIADGLDQAHRQLRHFAVTHTNVVAGLADIYSRTISTLAPRIMVTGEHGHLRNADNANYVRALLLAGIRSAVLWRQRGGGGRLQLIFKRKLYLDEANRLLRTLCTDQAA